MATLTNEQREQLRQQFFTPSNNQVQSSTGSVSDRLNQIRQSALTGSQQTAQDQSKKKENKFLKFLGGLGKDIAKPFAEVGTSIVNYGESVFDLLRGDTKGASEALDKTRNVPFLGETQPAFSGQETTGEAAKKIFGYGAEIGSNLVGGVGAGQVGKQALKGLVAEGLKTGAVTGLISGALGVGGRSAQEGDKMSEILLSTVGGGALGATLGAGIGGASPVVGKAIRNALRPVQEKVSMVLRDAINKGIKPYFANKTNKALRDKFYQRAEEAFVSIYKRKPTILDTEVGQEVARLPQNRVEMLDALNKTKQQVYNEYHALAQNSGEAGALFNADTIVQKLDETSKSLKYSPEIRKYAESLKADIAELSGQTPEIIEARIQELNNSLSGLYDGGVSKTKAQVDASVASAMREELDSIIEKTTGQQYQALKNEYAALKSVEKDLSRQVAVELRKNTKGLIDFPDIFTGGDIAAGALTGNPALLAKGVAGKALTAWYKRLNDPNRYIKNAFEILENPPADLRSAILGATDSILKIYQGVNK